MAWVPQRDRPSRTPHVAGAWGPRPPLPIDPGLHSYLAGPERGRFTTVRMVRADGDDEVVATEAARAPATGGARVAERLRRTILGPPLRSSAVVHERVRKLVGLPVFSSDALSSVAYGPEAMLAVLVLGGSGALGASLPIALIIAILMVAVGASYRQTIRAYPHGGGSYLVASENLGRVPGLAAAAGLMADYVLTVAVSIAAGIAAVTSAVPALRADAPELGLAVVAVLLAGNLRGMSSAGRLFAVPTYAFVAAIGIVVAVGAVKAAAHGFATTPAPRIEPTEPLGALLILRAFASGATAMTGIEAISNAVPAFQPTAWRNARTTLTWMVSLLLVMFAGTVVLVHLDGIVPRAHETVLSQLARASLGGGPLYAGVQAATALVLLLAANTAFNGFPRLLYFMARDGHAPRAFLHVGDRLAYSNGIIALVAAAAVLLVVFDARTDALIPLYAVGVFLAFTLSQVGMVVHWRRHRERGWRRSAAINAAGAALSAAVLAVTAVGKFTEGAWLVLILIPGLVLCSLAILRLYRRTDAALSMSPGSWDARAGETQESPDQVRHLVVVPVEELHLASVRALAYAASLGTPVLAVHISTAEQEATRFRERWEAWGDYVPLQILASPYRAIVAPLAHYVAALHAQRPELTVTVVVPELVVHRAWQRLFHDRVAPRLRRALREQRGLVITTVPFHL
jgi:amino acid transporter